MSKQHEFAIYRGETYMDSGTAIELAKKFNCKPNWIRHMSTPAHAKKIKQSNKAKFSIKLGPI